MFYLENKDGGFWSKDFNPVDDLDRATSFDTFQEAVIKANTLVGAWTVFEDNVFGE